MDANYPEIYKAVRVFEGGNDDDPQDPGGRTSRGIIQREWDRYRREPANIGRGLPLDVWKASEADIAIIYRRDYFDSQNLGPSPSGYDETEFDYGVNSGVGRSQKVARRCLHMPDNAPRSELDKRLADLTKEQVKLLINAINDERMAFLRSLHTFPRFGRGWTSRVAKCRSISLHLADFPPGVQAPQPIPQPVPGDGKAKAQHPEPTAAKKAVTAGGAGAPAVAGATWHDWVTAHPRGTVVIVVAVIAAIGGAIYLINRWHKNRQEAAPPGWVPPQALKPVV